MTTAFFTHPDCLLHDNGPGHPECPDRLRAVLAELAKPAYDSLMRLDAPLAAQEQLIRVHAPDYVDAVFAAIPETGHIMLDADTGLCPASGVAARRAAGAVIAAVDAVLTGSARNAFCAVRPPGHHAERATAMGFCLFNNIAIGAAHALAVHGLQRVAIVDFDVHHGNGTADWAQNEARAFFISSHQSPLWPGTGRAQDRGGLGNLLNLPLPRGTDGAGFLKVWRAQALPALDAFRPELLLISAGFDAHRADPLADLRLAAADFGDLTIDLCAIASRHAQGRVVSTLEGGYDLDALAASAGAHVGALLHAAQASG